MRKALYLLVPTLIGSASLAATTKGGGASPAQPSPAVAAASAAVQAPAYAANEIAYAIADWRRLRRGEGYAFADYARFLIYNPDWPGDSALRLKAERAMRAGEAPATVLAFFATKKPRTGNGYARLAESLLATARPAEALAAAREAWGSSDLSPGDEMLLYARFGGSLTWQDHERRADALLFDKQPKQAQRFLALVSPARRPAFAARIAMQSRAPDAETLFQAVSHRLSSDAGLWMDRARYYRDANDETGARRLAALPHNFSDRPADPDRFLDMLLILAGGAAEAGDYRLAYEIARQVDDIFAPNTDMTDQSYDVRDKYTSLTWLAGTAAHSAGRPADAIGQFQRYAFGGKSLQVATKGLYWAGRAAMAANRPAAASAFFQRAASYPELFYGQLALERLGRSVPTPPGMPRYSVMPADRSAFYGNRLVRAVQYLLYNGNSEEQTLFVRALAESLTGERQRVLATEMAQQLRRDDLAVWVARASRNAGQPFYYREAFPTLRAGVPGGNMWSLTHGITRQESSFDARAISHAGARGMMQLMPGTAREQAGKMGLGYDGSRLTSDPAYNVMIGSAYFSRLLSRWDGNVPLAVASYNAGAGNVRRWVERYGDPRGPKDVVTWIEQIPFGETRGYVQRVIENSVVYDEINPGTPNQMALHVSRFLGKRRPG